jgi:hypothetical protein
MGRIREAYPLAFQISREETEGNSSHEESLQRAALQYHNATKCALPRRLGLPHIRCWWQIGKLRVILNSVAQHSSFIVELATTINLSELACFLFRPEEHQWENTLTDELEAISLDSVLIS